MRAFLLYRIVVYLLKLGKKNLFLFEFEPNFAVSHIENGQI